MARKSLEELAAMITEAGTLVKVGGKYEHYKNTNPEHIYIVKGFSILEATEEVAVIYESQEPDHVSFIRPLADFLAIVEWEGQSVPRFALRG